MRLEKAGRDSCFFYCLDSLAYYNHSSVIALSLNEYTNECFEERINHESEK